LQGPTASVARMRPFVVGATEPGPQSCQSSWRGCPKPLRHVRL